MTPEPNGETVEIVHLEPQPTVVIRTTIPPNDMIELEPVWIAKLTNFLQARGLAPSGPAFHRYHTFSHEITDMEAGFPVAAPVEGEGEITAAELPGGPAASAWLLGSYERMGEPYARVEAYIAENNLETNGPAWEYYWVNPGGNPDPEAWRTQLLQPIKK